MVKWRRRIHRKQREATALLAGAGAWAVGCMLLGLVGMLFARTLIWAHYNGYTPYSKTGGDLKDGSVLIALVAVAFTLLALELATVLDWRAMSVGGTVIAIAWVGVAVGFMARTNAALVCSADCGLRAFGPGPRVVMAFAAVYELGVVSASFLWMRQRQADNRHPSRSLTTDTS